MNKWKSQHKLYMVTIDGALIKEFAANFKYLGFIVSVILFKRGLRAILNCFFTSRGVLNFRWDRNKLPRILHVLDTGTGTRTVDWD